MKVIAMLPATVAGVARKATRGRTGRFVAILFSFLMLGPVVPLASAQDPLAQTLPTLPALGNAHPTDHCLAIGDVEPTALQAANQVQQDGVSYFAYDHGVPAICLLNGQPVDQWQYLVSAANSVLDQYRQVATLLQKQADQRAEYTVPQGACSPNDNSTRVPNGVSDAAKGQQPDQSTLTNVGTSTNPQQDNGVHCGITHPQFVILDDRFDGARVGGFGSWQTVTAHGEAGGFYLDSQRTFNGTEAAYRFGDANGYTQGAHAFLVSPELDLTAVRGNQLLANELQTAYSTADTALVGLCHGGNAPGEQLIQAIVCPDSLGGGRGGGSNINIAGQSADLPSVAGARIIDNFRVALKSYTAALPLSRETASLDITFKMNMQQGVDGVRPWLYIGDHQPTRAELYDRHVFGAPPTIYSGCASEIVNQTSNIHNTVSPLECNPVYQNGYLLLKGQDNGYGSSGYPNTTQTNAFTDPDLSNPSDADSAKAAFSGDVAKPLTIHANLTAFMGQRVWLVFEAQTVPDTGRGGDKFHDTGNFPRQDGSFGFQLLHAHAQGDAWPRDLRVKDVAATYPPVAAHDAWNDARTTLTTTPNGTPPLVVRLQNAGGYRENATITLDIQEQLGAAPGSGLHEFATTEPVVVREIKPSEVRIVSIPWPKQPVNTNLYNITATLKLLDAGGLRVTDTGNLTDPNSTAVRPTNAPELPPNGFGGSEVAYAVVRAFEDHHLTPAHEPTTTSGPALEVCKSIGALGCVPEYSGAKGEQRIVHGGIRNDGSQPETIQATLVMLLGGLERPEAVVGDRTITLTDVQPGEVRPVNFGIAPADAGVYTARVIYSPLNATSAAVTASRLVFVERSTGIICYDDAAADRECAPSFQRSTPDVFQPSDLSGVSQLLQLSLASLPQLLQQDRAAALALAQNDRDDYLFSMSFQVAEQDPALDASVTENLTRLVRDVANAGVGIVQSDAAATSGLLATAGLRGSHGGLDVTASAQAPDGTAYVTAVDVGTDKYPYQDATGLYARAPGSTTWTKVLDLTNATLSQKLGEQRDDLAWSNVTTITVGNGTVYMAGLSGTALAYDPTSGNLTAVPWTPATAGPLTLFAPDSFIANDTSLAQLFTSRTGISLVASAEGGAGSYQFHWNVTQDDHTPGPAFFLPADSKSIDPLGRGSFNASVPNATFTPTAVGDYHLNLTVSDAGGASVWKDVLVHVVPRDSGCSAPQSLTNSGALITQADANDQPASALAGNASLVRCLRFNWTSTPVPGSPSVVSTGEGSDLYLLLDLAALDTKETLTYTLNIQGDQLGVQCAPSNGKLTSSGCTVTANPYAVQAGVPSVSLTGKTIKIDIKRNALATGNMKQAAFQDDMSPHAVTAQVSDAGGIVYSVAGAGPGTFAFGTDTYSPTGITNPPTARFDPRDTHAVALNWTAASDSTVPGPLLGSNVQASTLTYVVQRAEPVTPLTNVSNWTTVGESSTLTFSDKGVAPYHTYAYRIIPKDGAGNLGTPTSPFLGTGRVVRPEFASSVWWNGTLWLAATNGIVWTLNQSSGRLEAQQLPSYTGNVGSLAVKDGKLYAAGEFDSSFVRAPTTSWQGPFTVPLGLGSTALHALALHQGELYAAGDRGTLLRLDPDAGKFVNVSAPLCASGSCDYAFAFEAPTGELYVMTSDGNVAACSVCDADSVAWSYPEVPLPAFTRNNAPQPSIVLGASTNETTVMLVTTGGSVLEFGARSPYANRADWTTLPTLAPHDGGALQTKQGSTSQNGEEFRWGLSNAGSNANGVAKVDLGAKTASTQPSSAFEDPNATGWVQLRVTFNDSRFIGPFNYNALAQVRVYYDAYPTVVPQLVSGSVPSSCEPNQPGDGQTVNAALATCNNTLIMSPRDFTSNTTRDGWVPETFYVNAPDTSSTTSGYGLTQPAPQVHFDSISFYVKGTMQWAIDDFRVDAKDTKGVWHPLVSWYGPPDAAGSAKNRGMSYNFCDPTHTGNSLLAGSNGAACLGETSPTTTVWEGAKAGGQDSTVVNNTFGLMTASPWHLSNTITDRPVWTLNDELMQGGSSLLQGGWDTRLVTPIIDLSQAYDPVFSFRTAYAFRTGIGATLTTTNIYAYDGGWLEVQYEKHGTECDANATPDVTCWSLWTKVYPEHAGTPPTYPTAEDLGYIGKFVRVDNGGCSPTDATHPANCSTGSTPVVTRYGDTVGLDPTTLNGNVPASAHSVSFWGRSPTMQPTPAGTIVGARDTASYEPFQVRFSEPQNRVRNDYGEVVNLSGRAIRIGFHALTSNAPGAAHCDVSLATCDLPSFYGEGWYVTDLKVNGATIQGMDLAATNLSFRVGYDEARIGVGPGTSVPVNVTIENRGQFDVPGYTGTLDVRRVVDATNGRTLPVASIPMSQQPLLAAGASVNHTFTWNVPADEGATYVLSFTVTPIGIGRDEDITDNVATLGSLSAPILAQTHKEFHVEFQVSPQNATSEIVRYVPIFVNNTGNVPLSGFVVNRTISLQRGGIPDPAPDVRSWPTERPVAAGTRANLQAISDEYDPASDLFWNASQRSDYKFFVAASAPDVPVSTTQLIVRSYATYLFDDAELGPRGEAVKPAACNGQKAPDWCFDNGWGVLQPGFLSSRGYGFGDNVLVRYPDNADASAVSPILDISGARSARFGFYTKFLFPDSFDGGVVEASVDGGKTWQRLVPETATDPINGTNLPGYPSTVEASSALSLTGDPSVETRAFTGDSRNIPGNQDGWVYREFDLTTLPNVTEAGMPYVQYPSSALQAYSGLGEKDLVGAHPSAANNTYFDSTWNTGPLDKYQYFEHDNLTENTVVSPLGHPTFWWSGSANILDDGNRPVANEWLDISLAPAWYVVQRRDDGSIARDADGYPIPLDASGNRVFVYDAAGHLTLVDDGTGTKTNVPLVASDGGVPRTPALRIDPKDTVVADWWEWTAGFDMAMKPISKLEFPAKDLYSVYADRFQGANAYATARVNITQPTILERKSGWTHFQSTLTDVAPTHAQTPISNIQFLYAPVQNEIPVGNGTYLSKSDMGIGGYAYPLEDGHYGPDVMAADRGFAVDGFNVRAYKVIAGQHVDERVLLASDDAWNASAVRACADPKASWTQSDLTSNPHAYPCEKESDSNKPNQLQGRMVLPAQRALRASAVQQVDVRVPAGVTTAQLDVGGSYIQPAADIMVDVLDAATGQELLTQPVELTLSTSIDQRWVQPPPTFTVPASREVIVRVTTLQGAASISVGLAPTGGAEFANQTLVPALGWTSTPSAFLAPATLTTTTLVDPNVDFQASKVRAGDLLNVSDGVGKGFRALVTGVTDAHTLALGAADVAPPTADGTGAYLQLTGSLLSATGDVQHVPLVLNARATSTTSRIDFRLDDAAGTPTATALDAAIKVGDRLRFVSGGVCATACPAAIPIVSAPAPASGLWQLTVPALPFTTAQVAGSKFVIESAPAYSVLPFEGNVSASWAQVHALPGIPAQWRTVDVRDAQNHSDAPDQRLNTGETPKAWYTNGLCIGDEYVSRATDKVPSADTFTVQQGTVVRLQVDQDVLNATNFTVFDQNINSPVGARMNALPMVGDQVTFTSGPLTGSSTFITAVLDKYNVTIQPLAMGTPVPAGSTFRVFHYERDCLRQQTDSRLVLPAVDLSNVAGEDAVLTFWHRYAFGFGAARGSKDGDPIGSGGVVEISVLDPLTGWSDWRQIYADDANKTKPDDPRTGFDVRDRAESTLERDGEALGIRGGYDVYTVPYSSTADGAMLRYGMPFDVLPHTRADGKTDPVQFYYGGSSAHLTDDPLQAWVPAQFDLSPYLGKVVRIGFHVAVDGDGLANQNKTDTTLAGSYTIPDAATRTLAGTPPTSTGWWITNISVTGKVIEGAPVQFRFRAATDRSVHDGYWEVDDVGLYGAHYGRNVGLFVDPRPNAYGAFANNSTIVNVTLRNLGDTVRRDLAVEVRQTGGTAQLTLASTDDQHWTLDTSNAKQNILRISGFNLAPGQSVVVPVVVRVPAGLAQNVTLDTLHIVLKEYSPADGKFVPITDNEVVGFLTRDITFTAQRDPLPVVAPLASSPAVVSVGQVVDVIANVTNAGFGPFHLDLTCTATLVGDWNKVDHGRGQTSAIASGTATACTLASGSLDVGAGQTTTLDFHVTPPGAGSVYVVVNGTLEGAGDPVPFPTRDFTVLVGVPTSLYHDDFPPKPLPQGVDPSTADPSQRDGDVQYNWTSAGKPGAQGTSGTATYAYPEGHDAPGSLVIGSSDTAFNRRGIPYENFCAGQRCLATSNPIDLHNFTTEHLLLSFWQMPKFANYDGGIVTASVLRNERDPTGPSSWSGECRLYPVGGYPGAIRELYPVQAPGGNQNNPPNWQLVQVVPNPTTGGNTYVWRDANNPTSTSSIQTTTNGAPPPPPPTAGGAGDDQAGYAKAFSLPTPTGPASYPAVSGSSDAWTRMTFDLSQATCYNENTGLDEPLLGHTVRFNFDIFVGPANGDLHRGAGPKGQGWFIDDVSLTPVWDSFSPASQSARLLDNTTKTFHVLVRNPGSYADQVAVSLDSGNSSTPDGSVRLPPATTVSPGATAILPVQVTLPRDPSLLPTQYRARLVVRSLLDQSVSGTSDLVLDFAPREWAELSLHADAPTQVVQEGTEAFVPITIENDGITDSVASTISILDSWTSSSGANPDASRCTVAPAGSQFRVTCTSSLDLPSIPSYFQRAEDATRVFEYSWKPYRGSVGTHQLTITADPQQIGEEYTRTNNVVVLNVPVSDLLVPDLDISAPDAVVVKDGTGQPALMEHDADVTHWTVTAGELATVQVTLKNTGKAGATNVDLRAFIGTLSLPKKTIPFLPAGSQTTVTFNWLAQKGEYPLEVIAQTDQVELSTLNDRNPAKGVTILTVKGYDVKTMIDDLAQDAATPADVKVPFHVTNAGNAGEDLLLRARLPADAKGWTITMPRDALFLRTGETYSATATVHIPDGAVAGGHLISIEAVARENPLKVASASASLGVHAIYGGSVAAVTAIASPPTLALPIQLSNEGNSLEPWTLTMALPSGWTSVETLPARVVVPPHGETTFLLHVLAPATTPPGARQLDAKATLPDGTKRDGVITLDVRALRTASVEVADPAPAEVQGALSYPVTVENVGNVQQPFQVLLLNAPTGVDARLEPSNFSLPPGGKTLATLIVKPTSSVAAGAYQIDGYTLFEGVHPDTAEGVANRQTLALTLVRPDLRAGVLETAPRSGVKAGDRVAVKVPVTNAGQGAVTDLPVHLFMDDKFVAEARIPVLNAGETRAVTLNWTALPGSHTLTAVVDPWNDTVDAQRDDNAAGAVVTVQTAGLSGLAGSSKVPAPGLLSLFIAAAAAVALAQLARRRPPR